MTKNKGSFKIGNKFAQKPKKCPFCHKELKVVVYAYVSKKIESRRIKTQDCGIKQEVESRSRVIE